MGLKLLALAKLLTPVTAVSGTMTTNRAYSCAPILEINEK